MKLTLWPSIQLPKLGHFWRVSHGNHWIMNQLTPATSNLHKLDSIISKWFRFFIFRAQINQNSDWYRCSVQMVEFNVPSVTESPVTWSQSEWFWLLFTYIQFYVVNYYIICVETLIMESSIYNRMNIRPSITVSTAQCSYSVLVNVLDATKSDANISRSPLVPLSYAPSVSLWLPSHVYIFENKFDLNVSQIGTYIYYQYEKT